MPPVSFRHFLQTELARRCARNKQYSLRAFAKFLEMDHSTLSQLLRGTRRITDRTVRRCGIRLGLDEESVIEFMRAKNSESASNEAALVEVRKMASDTASLIAEWQHHAILELVRIRDFRPDSRWIARVLGLSIDEVNVALQRLLRLGLLSMDAPDRWTDRSGDVTASVQGFTRTALQRLVENAGKRLVELVDKPAGKPCVYSSTTVAIPAGQIAEVAGRIEQFRRELLAFIQAATCLEDVYRLEISFVPLTNLTSLEDSDGTTRSRLADRDPTA